MLLMSDADTGMKAETSTMEFSMFPSDHDPFLWSDGMEQYFENF